MKRVNRIVFIIIIIMLASIIVVELNMYAIAGSVNANDILKINEYNGLLTNELLTNEKKLYPGDISGIDTAKISVTFANIRMIKINGVVFKPERDLLAVNNRVLVPVSFIKDIKNISINWNDRTSVLIIKRTSDNQEGMQLTIAKGSLKALSVEGANEKVLTMDVPFVVYRGTVMVPVRMIAEYFGMKVDWIGDEAAIYLSDGSNKIGNSAGNGYENSQHSGGGSNIINSSARNNSDKGQNTGNSSAGNSSDKGQNTGNNSAGNQTSENKAISKDLTDRNSNNNISSFKIVIDPGHGGTDKGAFYGNIYEKNLNLDIAKRLQTLLFAKGIKVYMTRTTDVNVNLYKRTEFANKTGAHLFVSIHNNAYKSKLISGSMTLYHPSNRGVSGDTDNRSIAGIIQKYIISSLLTRDKGIIPRPNLVVLRTTKMPAVLIEVGYMTNEKELSRLKDPSYRQKSAEAIMNGVIKCASILMKKDR